MLPKELAKIYPKDHLMSEAEWRSIGVQQSRGWQHYLIHEPGDLKNKLVDFYKLIFYQFYLKSRATHSSISPSSKLCSTIG
jgi:hypothetical protein